MTTTPSPDARWTRRRTEKQRRLEQVRALANGVVLPTDRIVAALEALLVSGDRVVLEGNNQKQADFLSRALAKVDPGKVHDLHMIMPSVGRSEHLDLFEQGIARKLDFSFAGTQSLRISQLLEDGLLEIGAIHTYIELYSRLVVDLIPNVVLAAGFMADRAGNIYTGPSTEDTPALIEPAAFSDGIVIVQVNQLVDDVSELPRVDIPASWVDFVVVADKPFYIEPLFTRDPRHIKPVHVLMAMMAIRGIYEKHNVQSLNHGIGFNTAAIELILPTYGESLGLKGKICRNWTLNPHPTLIPAIESGWVESVHCFGTELGMENYIAARPDVFFTGRDGSLRSNRQLCQLAGQYAVDLFIGATLQVDGDGHSSTVTRGRLAGFGGAPNMGHDPRGRRHATPAWLDMRQQTEDGPAAYLERGKKLVVQMVETFQEGGKPTFVETLDAVEVAKKSGMPLAPIMIYGDDVTHLLTEEGIAYLYKARSLEERQAMIAAVAGVTVIGLRHNPKDTARMRREGLIALPEDLGIRRTDASRELLAAKSIADLVQWSGGLYNPPAKFRSW
ncbi:malonate decarboxylase subunit alpha [Pseudomonas syringae pv. actinidiae]|uniref:Acyl CoA:acetate/3-ketoacid CoA transferase n=1 Tax=Pseudomonas syringae pv. actinidiae TaxID=103796 RepID=A0A0K8LUE1_PSESF|nr:malonate decarboxylase subunit alpha [Pseudomonas syringae]AKT32938.1 malonate decarboxylase subunit alpha [Pseudomonas syringae pv. actinidiae ICMP 18884]AOE59233.1 malonate decarboxylase subunit alpha [Pseudomonas syringae pv. actinidiae ICMP 18708]APQ00185.1 malonate decarboxylase subunit alpha [Pseudomonas syringae pv. actinidiae]APQ05937.1 malonate decarboxylase subunit alpha [Pseudomonas syringae pv. actinidiae]AQL35942.1 malonate decarboxylase subunit alpha [Pseudomonas syringae pv. 